MPQPNQIVDDVARGDARERWLVGERDVHRRRREEGDDDDRAHRDAHRE